MQGSTAFTPSPASRAPAAPPQAATQETRFRLGAHARSGCTGGAALLAPSSGASSEESPATAQPSLRALRLNMFPFLSSGEPLLQGSLPAESLGSLNARKSPAWTEGKGLARPRWPAPSRGSSTMEAPGGASRFFPDSGCAPPHFPFSSLNAVVLAEMRARLRLQLQEKEKNHQRTLTLAASSRAAANSSPPSGCSSASRSSPIFCPTSTLSLSSIDPSSRAPGDPASSLAPPLILTASPSCAASPGKHSGTRDGAAPLADRAGETINTFDRVPDVQVGGLSQRKQESAQPLLKRRRKDTGAWNACESRAGADADNAHKCFAHYHPEGARARDPSGAPNDRRDETDADGQGPINLARRPSGRETHAEDGEGALTRRESSSFSAASLSFSSRKRPQNGEGTVPRDSSPDIERALHAPALVKSLPKQDGPEASSPPLSLLPREAPSWKHATETRRTSDRSETRDVLANLHAHLRKLSAETGTAGSQKTDSPKKALKDDEGRGRKSDRRNRAEALWACPRQRRRHNEAAGRRQVEKEQEKLEPPLAARWASGRALEPPTEDPETADRASEEYEPVTGSSENRAAREDAEDEKRASAEHVRKLERRKQDDELVGFRNAQDAQMRKPRQQGANLLQMHAEVEGLNVGDRVLEDEAFLLSRRGGRGLQPCTRQESQRRGIREARETKSVGACEDRVRRPQRQDRGDATDSEESSLWSGRGEAVGSITACWPSAVLNPAQDLSECASNTSLSSNASTPPACPALSRAGARREETHEEDSRLQRLPRFPCACPAEDEDPNDTVLATQVQAERRQQASGKRHQLSRETRGVRKQENGGEESAVRRHRLMGEPRYAEPLQADVRGRSVKREPPVEDSHNPSSDAAESGSADSPGPVESRNRRDAACIIQRPSAFTRFLGREEPARVALEDASRKTKNGGSFSSPVESDDEAAAAGSRADGSNGKAASISYAVPFSRLRPSGRMDHAQPLTSKGGYPLPSGVQDEDQPEWVLSLASFSTVDGSRSLSAHAGLPRETETRGRQKKTARKSLSPKVNEKVSLLLSRASPSTPPPPGAPPLLPGGPDGRLGRQGHSEASGASVEDAGGADAVSSKRMKEACACKKNSAPSPTAGGAGRSVRPRDQSRNACRGAAAMHAEAAHARKQKTHVVPSAPLASQPRNDMQTGTYGGAAPDAGQRRDSHSPRKGDEEASRARGSGARQTRARACREYKANTLKAEPSSITHSSQLPSACAGTAEAASAGVTQGTQGPPGPTDGDRGPPSPDDAPRRLQEEAANGRGALHETKEGLPSKRNGGIDLLANPTLASVHEEASEAALLRDSLVESTFSRASVVMEVELSVSPLSLSPPACSAPLARQAPHRLESGSEARSVSSVVATMGDSACSQASSDEESAACEVLSGDTGGRRRDLDCLAKERLSGSALAREKRMRERLEGDEQAEAPSKDMPAEGKAAGCQGARGPVAGEARRDTTVEGGASGRQGTPGLRTGPRGEPRENAASREGGNSEAQGMPGSTGRTVRSGAPAGRHAQQLSRDVLAQKLPRRGMEALTTYEAPLALLTLSSPASPYLPSSAPSAQSEDGALAPSSRGTGAAERRIWPCESAASSRPSEEDCPTSRGTCSHRATGDMSSRRSSLASSWPEEDDASPPLAGQLVRGGKEAAHAHETHAGRELCGDGETQGGERADRSEPGRGLGSSSQRAEATRPLREHGGTADCGFSPRDSRPREEALNDAEQQRAPAHEERMTETETDQSVLEGKQGESGPGHEAASGRASPQNRLFHGGKGGRISVSLTRVQGIRSSRASFLHRKRDTSPRELHREAEDLLDSVEVFLLALEGDGHTLALRLLERDSRAEFQHFPGAGEPKEQAEGHLGTDERKPFVCLGVRDECEDPAARRQGTEPILSPSPFPRYPLVDGRLTDRGRAQNRDGSGFRARNERLRNLREQIKAFLKCCGSVEQARGSAPQQTSRHDTAATLSSPEGYEKHADAGDLNTQASGGSPSLPPPPVVGVKAPAAANEQGMEATAMVLRRDSPEREPAEFANATDRETLEAGRHPESTHPDAAPAAPSPRALIEGGPDEEHSAASSPSQAEENEAPLLQRRPADLNSRPGKRTKVLSNHTNVTLAAGGAAAAGVTELATGAAGHDSAPASEEGRLSPATSTCGCAPQAAQPGEEVGAGTEIQMEKAVAHVCFYGLDGTPPRHPSPLRAQSCATAMETGGTVAFSGSLLARPEPPTAPAQAERSLEECSSGVLLSSVSPPPPSPTARTHSAVAAEPCSAAAVAARGSPSREGCSVRASSPPHLPPCARHMAAGVPARPVAPSAALPESRTRRRDEQDWLERATREEDSVEGETRSRSAGRERQQPLPAPPCAVWPVMGPDPQPAGGLPPSGRLPLRPRSMPPRREDGEAPREPRAAHSVRCEGTAEEAQDSSSCAGGLCFVHGEGRGTEETQTEPRDCMLRGQPSETKENAVTARPRSKEADMEAAVGEKAASREAEERTAVQERNHVLAHNGLGMLAPCLQHEEETFSDGGESQDIFSLGDSLSASEDEEALPSTGFSAHRETDASQPVDGVAPLVLGHRRVSPSPGLSSSDTFAVAPSVGDSVCVSPRSEDWKGSARTPPAAATSLPWPPLYARLPAEARTPEEAAETQGVEAGRANVLCRGEENPGGCGSGGGDSGQRVPSLELQPQPEARQPEPPAPKSLKKKKESKLACSVQGERREERDEAEVESPFAWWYRSLGPQNASDDLGRRGYKQSGDTTEDRGSSDSQLEREEGKEKQAEGLVTPGGGRCRGRGHLAEGRTRLLWQGESREEGREEDSGLRHVRQEKGSEERFPESSALEFPCSPSPPLTRDGQGEQRRECSLGFPRGGEAHQAHDEDAGRHPTTEDVEASETDPLSMAGQPRGSSAVPRSGSTAYSTAQMRDPVSSPSGANDERFTAAKACIRVGSLNAEASAHPSPPSSALKPATCVPSRSPPPSASLAAAFSPPCGGQGTAEKLRGPAAGVPHEVILCASPSSPSASSGVLESTPNGSETSSVSATVELSAALTEGLTPLFALSRLSPSAGAPPQALARPPRLQTPTSGPQGALKGEEESLTHKASVSSAAADPAPCRELRQRQPAKDTHAKEGAKNTTLAACLESFPASDDARKRPVHPSENSPEGDKMSEVAGTAKARAAAEKELLSAGEAQQETEVPWRNATRTTALLVTLSSSHLHRQLECQADARTGLPQALSAPAIRDFLTDVQGPHSYGSLAAFGGPTAATAVARAQPPRSCPWPSGAALGSPGSVGDAVRPRSEGPAPDRGCAGPHDSDERADATNAASQNAGRSEQQAGKREALPAQSPKARAYGSAAAGAVPVSRGCQSAQAGQKSCVVYQGENHLQEVSSPRFPEVCASGAASASFGPRVRAAVTAPSLNPQLFPPPHLAAALALSGSACQENRAWIASPLSPRISFSHSRSLSLLNPRRTAAGASPSRCSPAGLAGVNTARETPTRQVPETESGSAEEEKASIGNSHDKQDARSLAEAKRRASSLPQPPLRASVPSHASHADPEPGWRHHQRCSSKPPRASSGSSSRVPCPYTLQQAPSPWSRSEHRKQPCADSPVEPPSPPDAPGASLSDRARPLLASGAAVLASALSSTDVGRVAKDACAEAAPVCSPSDGTPRTERGFSQESHHVKHAASATSVESTARHQGHVFEGEKKTGRSDLRKEEQPAADPPAAGGGEVTRGSADARTPKCDGLGAATSLQGAAGATAAQSASSRESAVSSSKAGKALRGRSLGAAVRRLSAKCRRRSQRRNSSAAIQAPQEAPHAAAEQGPLWGQPLSLSARAASPPSRLLRGTATRRGKLFAPPENAEGRTAPQPEEDAGACGGGGGVWKARVEPTAREAEGESCRTAEAVSDGERRHILAHPAARALPPPVTPRLSLQGARRVSGSRTALALASQHPGAAKCTQKASPSLSTHSHGLFRRFSFASGEGLEAPTVGHPASVAGVLTRLVSTRAGGSAETAAGRGTRALEGAGVEDSAADAKTTTPQKGAKRFVLGRRANVGATPKGEAAQTWTHDTDDKSRRVSRFLSPFGASRSSHRKEEKREEGEGRGAAPGLAMPR
ncbi:hypothetical protein BESB_029760 [Besnoitia besnoiti]|uniref:Uncharacterized protein n=1 Tax=Besnoitia besnoiti TaxID=94643 RepID=A0A2A9M6T8_BESBE|nr:hypothetical protein BESB_029760 [Besnoitia besnoiti]PFH31102.1 hypothetical protein BESB_029760 [Besnoitia besnoiti]